MDIPQQLVSLDSFATIGGISGAVVAVTNSMKNAFDWNPPWFGLLLAFVFCVVGAFTKEPKPHLSGVLIALVNGTIVYSSAVGMNAVGVKTGKQLGREGGGVAAGIGETGKRERPFFEPWF